eukprot:TRINITY_DN2377_c0_g1_i1.p1 TRINITY_DN2377_c0_g1~~TRINITY_DN2377_c0_g1_i1.p1  ORF type:complete len:271 (+),score=72.07 TRINITY_DN2377_c0_g1_i1:499-1311(+)
MSAQDLPSPTPANSTKARRSSPSKSKKTFVDVPVTRQEVGEFTSGYFVMPSTPLSPPHSKPHNHNNKAPSYTYPRSRQHTSPNKKKPTEHSSAPNKEKEQYHRAPLTKAASSSSLHTSGLLPTSTMTKKPSTVPAVDLSKAVELSSTSQNTEGKKSPPSTRWAGPAFINAPPPSALPMPSFDAPSTKLSPPSSPSKLTPWEALVQAASHPTLSTAPIIATPALSAYQHSNSSPTLPLPHIPLPPAHVLTQDLRRLLNIPTLTATPTLVRA